MVQKYLQRNSRLLSLSWIFISPFFGSLQSSCSLLHRDVVTVDVVAVVVVVVAVAAAVVVVTVFPAVVVVFVDAVAAVAAVIVAASDVIVVAAAVFAVAFRNTLFHQINFYATRSGSTDCQ